MSGRSTYPRTSAPSASNATCSGCSRGALPFDFLTQVLEFRFKVCPCFSVCFKLLHQKYLGVNVAFHGGCIEAFLDCRLARQSLAPVRGVDIQNRIFEAQPIAEIHLRKLRRSTLWVSADPLAPVPLWSAFLRHTPSFLWCKITDCIWGIDKALIVKFDSCMALVWMRERHLNATCMAPVWHLLFPCYHFDFGIT